MQRSSFSHVFEVINVAFQFFSILMSVLTIFLFSFADEFVATFEINLYVDPTNCFLCKLNTIHAIYESKSEELAANYREVATLGVGYKISRNIIASRIFSACRLLIVGHVSSVSYSFCLWFDPIFCRSSMPCAPMSAAKASAYSTKPVSLGDCILSIPSYIMFQMSDSSTGTCAALVVILFLLFRLPCHTVRRGPRARLELCTIGTLAL